ncbi:MAG: hypothetical protein HY576_07395, partial [candidate division NC10 bacterium]|nr:hypothetical protein [candidate division NC10 bacterium]
MRGARQVLAAVLAVVLVPVLLATAEAGGIERVKKAGVLKVGSDITYPPF